MPYPLAKEEKKGKGGGLRKKKKGDDVAESLIFLLPPDRGKGRRGGKRKGGKNLSGETRANFKKLTTSWTDWGGEEGELRRKWTKSRRDAGRKRRKSEKKKASTPSITVREGGEKGVGGVSGGEEDATYPSLYFSPNC